MQKAKKRSQNVIRSQQKHAPRLLIGADLDRYNASWPGGARGSRCAVELPKQRILEGLVKIENLLDRGLHEA
jgi:hypothetical protein